MAQQQVLRLGLGLNIQRSDGRIHSAVVSGLNEAQQSITVEWFEGGETKGKEVGTAFFLLKELFEYDD
jgi:kinesin family protein 2/24